MRAADQPRPGRCGFRGCSAAPTSKTIRAHGARYERDQLLRVLGPLPRVARAVRTTLPCEKRRSPNENGGARASVFGAIASQTENEDPHPQVVVAFGFLITNCAPSRPSV